MCSHFLRLSFVLDFNLPAFHLIFKLLDSYVYVENYFGSFLSEFVYSSKEHVWARVSTAFLILRVYLAQHPGYKYFLSFSVDLDLQVFTIYSR